MADTSFPFIVSSGPKVPRDPALRTLIRKQAMKDVGIARKKRGGYGRVNLRQHPTEEDTNAQKEASTSSSSTDSSTTSSAKSTPPEDTDTDATSTDGQLVLAGQTHDWLCDQVLTASLSNRNPSSGFDKLRLKYGFDVRDLSLLTSFNVGQSTMYAISQTPELLVTLLGCPDMQSYLQFIPSRYGHKPYLTAVVDCVSAKAHSRLRGPNVNCDAIVMRMYAKALASLQEAIACEDSSMDADLLCAIQMLSLHEVSWTAKVISINENLLMILDARPSACRCLYPPHQWFCSRHQETNASQVQNRVREAALPLQYWPCFHKCSLQAGKMLP